MSRLLFTVFAFFAVLAMAAPSAAVVTFSLVPQHGSADCGGETVVGLWANSPDPINNFQLALTYDESCVNIVDVDWPVGRWMLTDWNETATPCHDENGIEWLKAWSLFNVGSGAVKLCDITFRCNDADCCYCVSNLNFTCGLDCGDCAIVSGNEAGALPVAWIDGTFECGTLETLNFSKPLYKGWNLISLPLAPVDSNRSAVLATVTVSDDAVYRYNATSKEFESIGSADAMNTGTGYFVHATSDCPWEYSGYPYYAYNSTDISLEKGLNMVGWLNCSMNVDALSSISEYYYVTRWDVTAEKFEVYNPAAPSAFNDFTTMNRGTGYFISAKENCTLSESC